MGALLRVAVTQWHPAERSVARRIGAAQTRTLISAHTHGLIQFDLYPRRGRCISV